MRYSHEYKLKCVDLYRQGRWPETPPGISEENFRITIRRWVRLEEANGSDVLKHKNFNKVWTPEEKMELISKVLAGSSNQSVALEAGIEPRLLYQWVRKYKEEGYNGLVNNKKGRPYKEPNMKGKTDPRPLTESEREELIRLRAENEYIKAENEVIKKRIALREEKWAAQLKAKKQQSSKNSEKKDTN
jgi:transposase-like protein